MTLDEVEAAGGYGCVLVDPPWSYRQSGVHGRSNAADHYPTMTPAELADLRVDRLASRDALMFMWATWPHVETALRLGASWGFEYRTVGFVWVKRDAGRLAWGMGFWTRSNTEPCLLFVRGRPKRASASVHSVVEAPRSRHSAKPSEVRDRVAELVGDVAKVELFARERAPGWDCWGNEVESDVQLTTRAATPREETP